MEESRCSPGLLVVLTVIVWLLAPSPLLAQSVSGRVLDARSDTPVPAAAVMLIDHEGATAANTRTDDSGRFHLEAVPAGRYRLRVGALGYRATAGDEIELRGSPALVRVLVEPAAIETEGITVRVERLAARFRQRQVISGRVLDATNSEPIEGMDVLVRDVRGEDVDRTLSDQDGRFFVMVQRAGLYRLAVARFGYDSTATADVAVAPDQDLYLELLVQPAAVGLDPIRVTAPRTVPYLESTGFYGRMRRGHGSFFSPRDLERMPGAFPTQFLRRVAGLLVNHDGSITLRGVISFMGGPCSPTIVVDGMILRDTKLDDVVLMSSIDAMEVYKGPAAVPSQWRAAGVCGVIAVWTKH